MVKNEHWPRLWWLVGLIKRTHLKPTHNTAAHGAITYNKRRPIVLSTVCLNVLEPITSKAPVSNSLLVSVSLWCRMFQVCVFMGAYIRHLRQKVFTLQYVIRFLRIFFRGTGESWNKLIWDYHIFTRPIRKYGSLISNFSLFPKRTGTKFWPWNWQSIGKFKQKQETERA